MKRISYNLKNQLERKVSIEIPFYQLFIDMTITLTNISHLNDFLLRIGSECINISPIQLLQEKFIKGEPVTQMEFEDYENIYQKTCDVYESFYSINCLKGVDMFVSCYYEMAVLGCLNKQNIKLLSFLKEGEIDELESKYFDFRAEYFQSKISFPKFLKQVESLLKSAVNGG